MQNNINGWTVEQGDFVTQIDNSILEHERRLKRERLISKMVTTGAISAVFTLFIIIIKLVAKL